MLEGWTLADIYRFTVRVTLSGGVITDTIIIVPSREDLARQIAANPANVRFSDLKKLCEAYFGVPRRVGGSHIVYKTPWPGDPRVNIQNDKGKAKVYQVRQVLAAIYKLESGS